MEKPRETESERSDREIMEEKERESNIEKLNLSNMPCIHTYTAMAGSVPSNLPSSLGEHTSLI